MMDNNLIPRKVLFCNPDKALVTISSDGERIAYLSDRNNVLNVYVADRKHPDKGVPITDDKHRGIRNYFFAHDNKHVLYMQDKDGDEDWHIYSVNIDSLAVKDLTPFKKTRAMPVKVSEKIPNKIVVGINNRDPRYFDLYEADINSGKLELLHANKEGFVSQFVSDDDGKYELRFASKLNEDGSGTIYEVKKDGTIKSFLEIPLEDVSSTDILGFGETSNILYIESSIDRNTSSLIKYNMDDKTSDIIYHDEKTDIDNVLFHPKKKIIQVVYTNALRRSSAILDDNVSDDIKYLETVNKGAELHISDRDLNDNYWIVGYLSDTKPYSYYLYDRRNKKAEFLFSNRKSLEKYKLSPMIPVVIKSRDGLDLVSYLTLPRDVLSEDKSFVPTKPVPLVLDVHGGPKGVRDRWGISNNHQWLANRGYAVLSINYRSSEGFGKKFVNEGNGQWGSKMHNDLLDAVDWAIDNKITTKDKVAIFGGSYGGYAALIGATFTPDVFACAVSIVGPSNLITFVKSTPRYWEPLYKHLLNMVGGDPDTHEGREFLKSRSPLTYVQNIKKPLLIAQGANDPRVNRAESDQIVKAMKKAKIPVTYLLYPDEGHGFARPENNMSFYAIAEQFLKENLGGKAQAIEKDFEGSSIKILEGDKKYLKNK
jgi:dipeptidyl aminopeptidase/acylaminoacyl peptidase